MPRIAIIPGDGIGPETMAEVRKLIDWMNANRDTGFVTEEGLVGGGEAIGREVDGAPVGRFQRDGPGAEADEFGFDFELAGGVGPGARGGLSFVGRKES